MSRLLSRIVVLVAFLLGGTQAYQSQTPVGETLDGVVTYVIDGDTMRVNGVKIRLWGIDSPERDQAFYDDATAFLEDAVLWRSVSCAVRDTDRYGRLVAQCRRRKDDQDVGALSVQHGWARDYVRHSRRFYHQDEQQAKRRHRGMWQ